MSIFSKIEKKMVDIDSSSTILDKLGQIMNEEAEEKTKVIEIEHTECPNLKKLLTQIKKLADEGASFKVVVDPNNVNKSFDFDGDGGAKIISIEEETEDKNGEVEDDEPQDSKIKDEPPKED